MHIFSNDASAHFIASIENILNVKILSNVERVSQH